MARPYCLSYIRLEECRFIVAVSIRATSFRSTAFSSNGIPYNSCRCHFEARADREAVALCSRPFTVNLQKRGVRSSLAGSFTPIQGCTIRLHSFTVSLHIIQQRGNAERAGPGPSPPFRLCTAARDASDRRRDRKSVV